MVNVLKRKLSNHIKLDMLGTSSTVYHIGLHEGGITERHTEPLNDNGTMREDVFYDTLGTDYINLALTTAHAADPNAKLYINEYNIEYVGK